MLIPPQITSTLYHGTVGFTIGILTSLRAPHRLNYPAGIAVTPGTGGEGDDRVLRRGRDARVNDRPLQPVLDEILLFLRA